LGVRAMWTSRMNGAGIPEAFQLFLLQENVPSMHACIQGLQILLRESVMPSLYICGVRVVFVMGIQDAHTGVSVSDLPTSWISACKWGNLYDLSDVSRSMIRKVKRCLHAFSTMREALVQRGITTGVRATSRLSRAFVMSGGKGGSARAYWIAGIMCAYDFLAKHTSYPVYMRTTGLERNKYLCMTLAIHDSHMHDIVVPDCVLRVWKALRARYTSSQNEPIAWIRKASSN
jgi:hypothetical protein